MPCSKEWEQDGWEYRSQVTSLRERPTVCRNMRVLDASFFLFFEIQSDGGVGRTYGPK